MNKIPTNFFEFGNTHTHIYMYEIIYSKNLHGTHMPK